jgi:hypothetical protein
MAEEGRKGKPKNNFIGQALRLRNESFSRGSRYALSPF